jgi:hypothetical protein
MDQALAPKPGVERPQVVEKRQPKPDHEQHRIGRRGTNDESFPEHLRRRSVPETERRSDVVHRPDQPVMG